MGILTSRISVDRRTWKRKQLAVALMFLMTAQITTPSTQLHGQGNGPWTWSAWSPRKLGRHTILSPYGTPTESRDGLISLSDLTRWRSPRGLQATIFGKRVYLSAFDGSAGLVIDSASGRVLQASGSMRGLKGSSVLRVKPEDPSRSFLTSDGFDFLVNRARLAPLFQGYVRNSRSDRFELAIGPMRLGEAHRFWGKGELRRVEQIEYVPYGFADRELEIHILATARREIYDQGTAESVGYIAQFRNRSKGRLAVQPGLLAVSDGSTLPVVSFVENYSNFGPTVEDVKLSGGFGEPGAYLSGPSRFLKAGAAGEFSFRQMVSPGSISDTSPVKMTYNDGIRSYEFSLWVARKSTVDQLRR